MYEDDFTFSFKENGPLDDDITFKKNRLGGGQLHL